MFERIKSLFRKPKVTPVYTTFKPEDLRARKIDPAFLALMKENAALREENVRLSKEIENLKKRLEKEKKKKLTEEEKELIKIEENIKKSEKDSYRDIELKFPRPVILVSTLKGKTFGKFKFWRGIRLEEIDYEPYISLLISEKPKGKNWFPLKGRVHLLDFRKIFANPLTLLTDINLGKVMVNFHPETGELLLTEVYKPYATNGGGKKKKVKKEKLDEKIVKDIEQIKRIDLTKLLQGADPEVIEVIETLYEKWKEAESEKRRALKAEKEALMAKIDSEAAIEATQSALDRATSILASVLARIDTAYDRIAQLHVQEREARCIAATAEMEKRRLWTVLDNVLNRIEEMGIPASDIVKEEVKRDLQFFQERYAEMLETAKRIQTPPVIIEKEEKRK